MKRILILIIALSLVLSLAACSKKENNPLVGTWKDKDRDTLTLNKDGSYESTHYYDKEGTWEVEGDILTFKTLFDKEKKVEFRTEDKEGNKYMIFKEKDLIFGGDKETKFVKEK